MTQPPEPTSSRVKPDDLELLLQKHRLWIETETAQGAPAVLRQADLSGLDLRHVLLRGADLAGADLRGTDLSRADLQEADLTGADLTGADLAHADLRLTLVDGANFRGSDLRHADLSDSVGLLGTQLSGAILSSAKLPDAASKFEGLVNVTEASKTTQSLFASILLVSSYIWLTIASTTDAQLLNNAAPPSSRLPILGTDIPLVRFYLVAPLLLLSLYVYFHLCLQRLWEELGDLPAVFPDGRPLDKKAYPWLLNVLVRANVARLRHERTHLSSWQARMSIVLAWGLVPMTLTILWARYLRAHDWWVSLVHIGGLAAAIGAGSGFLHLAERTLRGSEKRPFLWKKAWTDARAKAFGGAAIATLLFGIVTYGAIEGVNPDPDDRGITLLGRAGKISPRRFVPQLFSTLGLAVFAHLDDSSLSTRPSGFTGKTTEEIATVKGADLTGRNLRYAAAYNSFFVNAYLMGADAQGTDFREADLRGADFREANLQGANFRSARMEGADLRWVDLTQANLRSAALNGARLSGAKLTDAQLKDAKLAGANLTNADLRGADLTGAVLDGANLAGADLTSAVGWTRPQLKSAMFDAQTRLPRGFDQEQVARRQKQNEWARTTDHPVDR